MLMKGTADRYRTDGIVCVTESLSWTQVDDMHPLAVTVADLRGDGWAIPDVVPGDTVVVASVAVSPVDAPSVTADVYTAALQASADARTAETEKVAETIRAGTEKLIAGVKDAATREALQAVHGGS